MAGTPRQLSSGELSQEQLLSERPGQCGTSEPLSAAAETEPVQLVVAAALQHPEQPSLIVWSAGRFIFAFDLERNVFDAWRLELHQAPIRSIDFCPDSSTWIICGDDKQVTVVDDKTYEVKHRFVFAKRPSAVRVAPGGKGLLWGDKSGELFLMGFEQLDEMTRQVVASLERHSKRNRNDQLAAGLYKDILNHHKTDNDEGHDEEEEDHTATYNGLDGDLMSAHKCNPFAGHLAQVTTLQIAPDGRYFISGDTDEKIRVGSAQHVHVTCGFALGHTEFISCLCWASASLFASCSGDSTLRLWAIAADTDQEEVVLAQDELRLPKIPFSLSYCSARNSFWVLCEGLSSVVEVAVKSYLDLSKQEFWKFDCENVRTIDLPFPPMSLVVTDLTASQQHAAFAPLCQTDVTPRTTAFFWTDRSGRLHLPVDLTTGKPVFVETQWKGFEIGDPIPTFTVCWWKHNRGAAAQSGTIARKRRRFREK